MDNCPICKHEFRGIKDFPRVRVLGFEKGDLEALVIRSSKGTSSPIIPINVSASERLSADEWKLLQKVESLFSNPQSTKRDGLGEYVIVGNSFDDMINKALADEVALSPQEREKETKRIAEFREGRIYREPVHERLGTPYLGGAPLLEPVPPLPSPIHQGPIGLPAAEFIQLSRPLQSAEPLPQKRIGWRYIFAEPHDKLLAQVTAYASRLESLVGTVVEPKELLKAELKQTLVFNEVSDYETKEIIGPDGTKVMRRDGKPLLTITDKRLYKSPRETGIHFSLYGGRMGLIPNGSPIVTIKYEGLLLEEQKPSSFTFRDPTGQHISSHD